MFPSILIQLVNGPNEFKFNLINLAVVEKTKQKKKKNIIELQSCTGMSRREKTKIKLIFFFNFQKIGSGGSVKRKIKKTLA